MQNHTFPFFLRFFYTFFFLHFKHHKIFSFVFWAVLLLNSEWNETERKNVDEREDGGWNLNSCRNTSAMERGGDERDGVREREGMWKCWERERGRYNEVLWASGEEATVPASQQSLTMYRWWHAGMCWAHFQIRKQTKKKSFPCLFFLKTNSGIYFWIQPLN